MSIDQWKEGVVVVLILSNNISPEMVKCIYVESQN